MMTIRKPNLYEICESYVKFIKFVFIIFTFLCLFKTDLTITYYLYNLFKNIALITVLEFIWVCGWLIIYKIKNKR